MIHEKTDIIVKIKNVRNSMKENMDRNRNNEANNQQTDTQTKHDTVSRVINMDMKLLIVLNVRGNNSNSAITKTRIKTMMQLLSTLELYHHKQHQECMYRITFT